MEGMTHVDLIKGLEGQLETRQTVFEDPRTKMKVHL